MKTPYTIEQDVEYVSGLLELWGKELEMTLETLQRLENTSSLSQIKLKRVLREMKESKELLDKKR